MTASETHGAIDAVWRIEAPRVIATLARITRDVGVAEDLAHDALVAALEQWPESGIPDNAGAWLVAAAKHRAIGGAHQRDRGAAGRRDAEKRMALRQETALRLCARPVTSCRRPFSHLSEGHMRRIHRRIAVVVLAIAVIGAPRARGHERVAGRVIAAPATAVELAVTGYAREAAINVSNWPR